MLEEFKIQLEQMHLDDNDIIILRVPDTYTADDMHECQTQLEKMIRLLTVKNVKALIMPNDMSIAVRQNMKFLDKKRGAKVNCMNEDCQDDPLNSPNKIAVTEDGDLVCNLECKEAYEIQRAGRLRYKPGTYISCKRYFR